MAYSIVVVFSGITTLFRSKIDFPTAVIDHPPMRTEDEIELLTAQLQAINLRLAQLEVAAAHHKEARGSSAHAAAATERSAQAAAATQSSAHEAAATTVMKGDRVTINNKLKRPSTWNAHVEWDQEKAQRATVTHLYKDQVHFVTDNGVKTWRAANNLTKTVEEA